MPSRRRLKAGCGAIFAFVLVLLVIALALAFYQGRRDPTGTPEYVALGSSFAAGPGLGHRKEGSPFLCSRTDSGYPSLLARELRLSLVDMSCGGSTARHVLSGGQFFQRPQLRIIDQRTRLVTLTVGGNDVGYLGDISMLAARHEKGALGWLARNLWPGPKTSAERDFSGLEQSLVLSLREIKRKAPKATIVVVTYPTVLPPDGTCRAIRLTFSEAKSMAEVGAKLAQVTRSAAQKGGAQVVDMHGLGSRHHACSDQPWVKGWTSLSEAPFHPNLAGAQATADAIAAKVSLAD